MVRKITKLQLAPSTFLLVRKTDEMPKLFHANTKIPSRRKQEGTLSTVWSVSAETKTPHDNKTDLSVSFFIRCLGSLIGTDARYSQPFGWRATQCCSAYALQSVLFSCRGIIARPFVFCNRSDEHFFAHAVNCRYVATIQLFLCRYTPFVLF